MKEYFMVIGDKTYNLSKRTETTKARIAAKGDRYKRECIRTKRKEISLHRAENLLASMLPIPKTWTDEKEYVSENFQEGHKEFLNEPDANAKWHLGYSGKRLIPSDLHTKNYYVAGYFRADTIAGRVLDDLKVRTIAMSDGTDRGITVFAVADSLAISNYDVRKIRELLKDFSKEHNIVSINIAATHTHSGLDHWGIFTNPIGNIIRNLFCGLTRIGKVKSSINKNLTKVLYEKVSESVKEAVEGMKPGEFYYASKDMREYMMDKRDPDVASMRMTRLRFVPDDGSKITYIMNYNVQPSIVGIYMFKAKDRKGVFISGDYVSYVEEIVEAQGHNFMFTLGMALGIASKRILATDGMPLKYHYQEAIRYGEELGRIFLAMSMTREDIKKSSLVDMNVIRKERLLGEKKYTLWYDFWEPVREYRVEPMLNIRLKEKNIEIENPLLRLAAKLKLINNAIIKDGKHIKTPTEFGYMELGKNLSFVICPGIMMPEVVIGGGVLKAGNSFSGRSFKYPSLSDILERRILIFGEANDATGGIIPENDFAFMPKRERDDEIVSYGPNFASTTIEELSAIWLETGRITKEKYESIFDV